MGGQQPQHAATAGGTSSGGFPAASSGQGPNRNLWIAMGVIVAAAAVIIGIIVTQGGGDDDPVAGGDGTTTTTGGSDSTGSDTTGTTSADVLPGYTQQFETQFVDSCAAGSTEAACQCIYDQVSHQIPLSDFIEMSTQMTEAGGDVSSLDDIPEDLQPILLDCVSADLGSDSGSDSGA
jgi:hypothetical protein